MHLLGLRTVCYKVSDLEKAKEWYTRVLATEPYFDQPFYVGFNIAGYELGLQPAEHASDIPSTTVTAYWGVANVELAFAELLEAGATAVEPPTNVGGELVVATVQDPWGNAFGVIYNPDFKAA